MDTATVAHARPLDTRESRALELYRTRGAEIVRTGPYTYLVPGSGDEPYAVNYRRESCDCPDVRRHPDLNCKHLLAVAVKRAKRRGATARRLAALEEGYDHELMGDDERLEILGLRRKLGL